MLRTKQIGLDWFPCYFRIGWAVQAVNSMTFKSEGHRSEPSYCSPTSAFTTLPVFSFPSLIITCIVVSLINEVRDKRFVHNIATRVYPSHFFTTKPFIRWALPAKPSWHCLCNMWLNVNLPNLGNQPTMLCVEQKTMHGNLHRAGWVADYGIVEFARLSARRCLLNSKLFSHRSRRP